MPDTTVKEQTVTDDTTTDTDTPPADSAAEADKEERAAFSDLYRRTVLAQESDTESEPEKKGAGRKAGKKAYEDSDSTETAEPEASDGTSEEQPEGFDQAISAVTRDGLPEERIQEWYKDKPEEFVSHGLKRAKAQADQDRYGNEYRDWLKSQDDDGQYDEISSEPSDEASEEVDISSIQQIIDEALAPLDSEENEDLLGEAKDPISNALSGLAKRLTTDLDSRLASELQVLNKKIAELQGHRVTDKLDMARERLVVDYPQLEDEKVQEEVLLRYDTIVESPGNAFNTVGGAYREAVKWTLADSKLGDLKSSMLKRAHSRRNGQPRATAAGSRDRNLTSEEQERLDFSEMYRNVFGQTA